VVGGSNGDEDVMVTVAQKRLAKGEKKTREMLFFPPTLASNFLMLNASNSPLFIKGGRGTLFLY
jgi:hypothetical protein